MLSIIVINYKNPPLLRLCLSSLNRTLAQSFDHEIIVVDVESSRATRSVVEEEFPSVQLAAYKENIGYTRGVNEGIKIAKGDYIFIMNPDVIPTPGSFEAMIEYLDQNKDIGLLGPQLLNFDDTPQGSAFRFYTPLAIALRRTFLGSLGWGRKKLKWFTMEDQYLAEPTPVDWLMGGALMVARHAAEKVGPMDEDLFLYMSDMAWPRRFLEKGYKVVYYPYAQMYHYHPRESKGKFGVLDIIFNKLTRWHIKDALRYFRKYGTNIRVKHES